MDRMRWTYRFDDIRVDPHSHRLTRAGSEVALEPKAFALLQVFLDRPGELLDRDQLLDLVWKHRHVGPATLNRLIAILRRALGDDAETPRYIETVHALGYRFVGQVEHEPAPGVVANPAAAVDDAPEAAFGTPTPAGAEAAQGTPARRRRWLVLAPIGAIAAAALAFALRGHAPVAPADKSIAVLPFQNMSAEPDNTYLVDGMRDEILTRLAGIRDIKVISRSSADQYASHPGNLREVGAQLGVASVLEGSVQKRGSSAHITLQLIDARSDAHLWADSYDRELGDVFTIEREIAAQVAAALQARLLPEESARVAREPTRSPQAYDHYLRSLAHFNGEDVQKTMSLPAEQGRDEVLAAISQLDKALALDPDFALARALSAQARMALYWIFEQRSDELLAAVKNSAEEALAQEPTLGEAHLALALYHYYGYHNYTLALREIELARRTLPNSAKVEDFAGLVLRRQGRWDEAVASLERRVALDPRRAAAHQTLATTYWWLRRYAEAARELAAASELDGAAQSADLMRGIFRMEIDGDMSAWLPVLDAMTRAGTQNYDQNSHSFYAYAWFTRDFPGAVRAAQASSNEFWFFGNGVHLPRSIWLAWVFSRLGDEVHARPLYEQARRDAAGAIERDPEDAGAHLVRGFAAAGLGLRDEAIHEGIESTELTPVSRDAIDGPDFLTGLSLIYLYVGANDEALALLQKLAVMPAARMATPGFLKLNAQWDPVRNDPRFAQAIAAGEAAIKSRPPGY